MRIDVKSMPMTKGGKPVHPPRFVAQTAIRGERLSSIGKTPGQALRNLGERLCRKETK